MKTAAFGTDAFARCLAVLPILLLLMVPGAQSSWNLSTDLDARLTDSDREEARGDIHIFGLSLRKTIADNDGDRLILFALFEAHDDFSERMLHEVYGRYKGPMGKWNLTLGRFGLPFGLLTDFTTSRLLFESLTPHMIGMDVDSGLMLSGVLGDVEYGLAATQGYGGHMTPDLEGPEVYSGRIGMTFGDSGDVRIGLSALDGKIRSEHHRDHGIDRRIVSADMTIQPGWWTARVEVQAGEIDGHSTRGAFAMTDLAVLPDLDLTIAGRLVRYHQTTEGYGYFGLGYRLPWFTIRGGYTYAHSETDEHIVSLQIYRMLSVPF